MEDVVQLRRRLESWLLHLVAVFCETILTCAHLGEDMVRGSPVVLEMFSPEPKPDADPAARNGSCM